MKKLILLAAIAAFVASCKDKDLYEGPLENGDSTGKTVEEMNTFDFSTVQAVDLSIDYSAFKTYGPVFFSVYSENPFEGEDESISLKEDVKPIYEEYTNRDGKYSKKVILPSYAKDLYVVTGNFLVPATLISGTIQDGKVSLVAENYQQTNASARSAAPRKAEATTSLETLYQLSYMVDVKTGDKTNTQIYKEWATPLGSWDRESGHPNYLLDKNTADSRLIFNEEEISGLYETVCNALSQNSTCNEMYRIQADLTLEKESEVSATFLGSMTCWNNTLGYYYYNDSNKPQSLMDVNIIMLFPNTQDGHWTRDWCPNPNFYGNIALERGDAVQLMYYPNIANGDLSGATTIFPKGTKIGFILKSNGWGMQKTQGTKKFFNSYNGGSRSKELPLARQYNVWAASTDGLSYCNTTGLASADCKFQNPEGLSRSAKFAYKNSNGNEYAIVGFEDACNDLDYDDIVLALKPADVFATLPKVEDKKTTTTGVYAFEDLWPSKGDYDLNDVMVEMTHEKNFTVKSGTTYKVNQETFYFTTNQNYVTLKSGLGVVLNTKIKTSSIVMKKVDPKTGETTDATFQIDGGAYILTEDVKAELGTTYIIQINYSDGYTDLNKQAEAKPFIYRTEGEGRIEVHIPYEAPTQKMITSYFGTLDDKSVPAENKYYVRSGNYPFAFYLQGVSLSNFEETLLKRENEKVKISDLYPYFLPWAESKGAEHADWYLHPIK